MILRWRSLRNVCLYAPSLSGTHRRRLRLFVRWLDEFASLCPSAPRSGLGLRSSNRHQLNRKLINIRRGEGGGERRGGPLWSPASCSLGSSVGERAHTPSTGRP